jgi:F-type H+-transporting ATPase subunit epsilon
MTSFKLKLLNPEKKYESSDVVDVMVPTLDGKVTFWAHHVSYLAALKSGEITIKDKNGKVSFFAISNGFAKFCDNILIILVGSFENAQDIDLVRAREQKEKLEKQIKESKEKIQDVAILTAFEKETARVMVAEKLSH